MNNISTDFRKNIYLFQKGRLLQYTECPNVNNLISSNKHPLIEKKEIDLNQIKKDIEKAVRMCKYDDSNVEIMTNYIFDTFIMVCDNYVDDYNNGINRYFRNSIHYCKLPENILFSSFDYSICLLVAFLYCTESYPFYRYFKKYQPEYKITEQEKLYNRVAYLLMLKTCSEPKIPKRDDDGNIIIEKYFYHSFYDRKGKIIEKVDFSEFIENEEKLDFLIEDFYSYLTNETSYNFVMLANKLPDIFLLALAEHFGEENLDYHKNDETDSIQKDNIECSIKKGFSKIFKRKKNKKE